MSKTTTAALLAALIGIQGACLAAEPAPDWTKSGEPPAAADTPPQARIAFARHGGIFDWDVASDTVVYIQDLHRQWYRADLMGLGCINLTFALRIGFTFEPNGDFDKLNSILYEHQTCPLTSLVMINPPPHHKGKVGTPGAVAYDWTPPGTDGKVAKQ